MKLLVGNVETRVSVGGPIDILSGLDIMQSLREYLRVKNDASYWARKKGKYAGDGWRYFITPTGKFATGFLPLVIPYLEELGVSVEIVDERGSIPLIDPNPDPYIGFIEGKDWVARDNQLDLVQKVDNWIMYGEGQKLYFPRGIFDAATNAGKNSMSALIMKNVPKTEHIIFMVNGATIFAQILAFLSEVFPDEKIGKVGDGKMQFERITVCMAKTLYNRAKESTNVRKILKDTGVLIVDESDESGAKDYAKILSYIGAGIRIFVSGTPLEAKKINNMISIGLSGKVLGKITNKQLIDAGYSQRPIVNIMFSRPARIENISYDTEKYHNLHTNENRADIISRLIKKHSGKSIVVSFIEKEHGYFMHEWCRQRNPDINMEVIHGESPDREAALDRFKKRETSVLFTSTILKRGANIPNIEVFIMAQGGKSVITIKQFTGRALRHDGINDTVVMYDFYDFDCKYLSKHSRDRIKIYQKEQFDIVHHYNSLRNIARDDAKTEQLENKFWE